MECVYCRCESVGREGIGKIYPTPENDKIGLLTTQLGKLFFFSKACKSELYYKNNQRCRFGTVKRVFTLFYSNCHIKLITSCIYLPRNSLPPNSSLDSLGLVFLCLCYDSGAGRSLYISRHQQIWYKRRRRGKKFWIWVRHIKHSAGVLTSTFLNIKIAFPIYFYTKRNKISNAQWTGHAVCMSYREWNQTAFANNNTHLHIYPKY